MTRRGTAHRMVADSIPDGGLWEFPLTSISPPELTLGPVQPLREISTRVSSLGVKAAGAWDWRPFRLHLPTVKNSGSLNLREPSGPI